MPQINTREQEETMEIKIMIVVGARPNFMKAAPIIAAIKQYNTKTGRDAFGVGNEDRLVESPALPGSHGPAL